MGLPKSRVFVALNAVRRRPTLPFCRKKNEGDDIRIVYLGRLIESKKPMELLLAFGRLEAKCELIYIGSGPEESKLKDYAEKFGLRVRFTGHLEGIDLQSELISCDLCVMPGLGGLAIQDAMAAGLPIIACDGDGTQFDYINAENGWILEDSSAQNLANTISHAISDLSRLRRMGSASFERIRSHLNLESMVKSVSAALDQAVNWNKSNR
jgi:glycosyltransferase involved in cell wall biosynthesis